MAAPLLRDISDLAIVEELHLLRRCKNTSIPSSCLYSLRDSLFQPAQIPNIGTFQDGGLRHNNPVNLALWESKLIWPSIKKPDLVLSLGTGTDIHPHSPNAPNFRHIFKDGFIPRLYRSFMSSLDGQSAWRDLMNRMDEQSREDFIRLNIVFPNEVPAINDNDQKEELRKSVHIQPRDDLETLFALLASRFFYKLDAIPSRNSSGLYNCVGKICCKLPLETFTDAMRKIELENCFFTIGHQILGLLDVEKDTCTLCHRYRKNVQFLIRDITEPINIQLQDGKSRCRRLSAFPSSINNFIDHQGLWRPFGRADHGEPGRIRCLSCDGNAKEMIIAKRKIRNFKDSTLSAKKPRLYSVVK